MKENKKLEEFEKIKHWYITILDYVALKIPELKSFAESTKENILSKYNNYSHDIYRGLVQSRKDINDLTESLNNLEYIELNNILRERFGENLDDYKAELVIKKVIQRGRIKSDEEFKLLEERMSDLSQIESSLVEIEKINKLLLAYENKIGR